jgi:cholesterol transport system auxiliary component
MTDRGWLVQGMVPAACSMLTACALLSKAPPLQPRYFTPEDGPALFAGGAEARASTSGAMLLRLGRVSAGPHLRERIVYRDSDHEVGYYEDRRWTERPEAYLRRALARMLFEERGLQRAVSGVAPTLEVELVAFEEIRAPAHKARMQVIITLDDDRVSSLEETITVEQDVPSVAKDQSAGALAATLSATMRLGVAQIAERVAAKLATLPPGLPAAPCVSSP